MKQFLFRMSQVVGMLVIIAGLVVAYTAWRQDVIAHERAALEALPRGYIVGYDTQTAGHISQITMHSQAATAPGSGHSLGYAQEGEPVIILEMLPEGPVKVRTQAGLEGWTDREFVQLAK